MGIVQGLTEFLPVSSSGHLLLLQRLGVGEPDLLFNVLVHAGTLAAVVVVYFRALANLVRHPAKSDLRYLVIASVPTAAIALCAKLLLPDWLLGKYLATGFAATTVFLVAAELFGEKDPLVNPLSKNTILARNGTLTTRNSLLIGLFQGFAVMPGLSRSGATISTALLLGYPREKACEFSFLLSVPIILASVAGELLEVFISPENAATVTAVSPAATAIPYAVGVIVAFVTGLLALRLMLRIVRSKRFYGFAAYTAVLAVVCLFL